MTEEKPNIQANNNSNAVGSISVDGDFSGNIHVGNVGYSSDEVSKLLVQISSTFQAKAFDGTCPYKGLDYFEEEDAELFFGREKLVEDLVSRVKTSRTVFITGPSGSGKSSVVRAGLIHALKRGDIKNSERWLYATMKPGRDPIEALALAFSRLKSPELGNYFRQNRNNPGMLHECAESALGERKNQRLVLFMDQFEEVFTQLSREEERMTFLNLFTHAANVEDGRVIFLFAMRSDFVPNCAVYPDLNATLNRQFIQIGVMQPEELVSAIAQPALRVGLRIDPDLIAQIISDMKGEPGSLPLMQFALKDLFEVMQAKGGLIQLTLNDYLQRGGIQKALERHADAAFQSLAQGEQELARSIFSGLIEIGRGTQDTKRTAIFDELVPSSAKSADIEAIVRKLADARLITTDEVAGKDTVTISHEKLIDAWPWLKKLVNENRDVIALQNQIATDVKEWAENKRDTSYLYTGARLANVLEQLASNKLSLGNLALEFISTSQQEEKRTVQEKLEKEKQVEFEKASTKRQRFLTNTLVVLFTLVLLVTYYWIYNIALNSVFQTYTDSLEKTLKLANQSINKENFVQLYEGESKNNPQCPPNKPTTETPKEENGYYPEENELYIAHVNELRRIQETQPDIKIYTYIKGIGPGEVIAIGSSGYFREPRGGFRFCQRYTSESSHIYKGLINRVDAWEPYSDSLGTWITTYAPLTDDNGNNIGAFGIDISVKNFAAAEEEITKAMVTSFLVTYIILLPLIYLISFYSGKYYSKSYKKNTK